MNKNTFSFTRMVMNDPRLLIIKREREREREWKRDKKKERERGMILDW